MLPIASAVTTPMAFCLFFKNNQTLFSAPPLAEVFRASGASPVEIRFFWEKVKCIGAASVVYYYNIVKPGFYTARTVRTSFSSGLSDGIISDVRSRLSYHSPFLCVYSISFIYKATILPVQHRAKFVLIASGFCCFRIITPLINKDAHFIKMFRI